MKRYIKTFESFSYLDFNSQDSEGGSRKYNTTIDEILTWAFGSSWNDYGTWSDIIEDLLFINGNFMEEGESIAALDKLSKHKDDSIEVEAYDGEYSIEIYFTFEGDEYSFENESFPFENDDMDDMEMSLTLRISDDLKDDEIMRLVNTVDISQHVEDAININVKPSDINSIGFKNWFNLLRYGNN
jgi:hypothetical protein